MHRSARCCTEVHIGAWRYAQRYMEVCTEVCITICPWLPLVALAIIDLVDDNRECEPYTHFTVHFWDIQRSEGASSFVTLV